MRWVIVDEIHSVAGTKRGAHLALSLERLDHVADGHVQRIGLSATQRPLDEMGRFLGGVDRPVTLVDVGKRKQLDLEVVVPLEDMDNPQAEAPPSGGSVLGAEARAEARNSVWPSIYPRLLELIQAQRSTLIFASSTRTIRENNWLRLKLISRAAVMKSPTSRSRNKPRGPGSTMAKKNS